MVELGRSQRTGIAVPGDAGDVIAARQCRRQKPRAARGSDHGLNGGQQMVSEGGMTMCFGRLVMLLAMNCLNASLHETLSACLIQKNALDGEVIDGVAR